MAHPETNTYVAPVTLEERLLHVREAERTIGGRIPWLCDTMDNDLKHALGNAPNCEFVIDPDGKIARLRDWSRPGELRQDLVDLVGPVENPTDPRDVDVRFTPPEPAAPTGVVPRLRLAGRLTPLVVTPDLGGSQQPFYVKLRAEAQPQVLRGGAGQLYLGFHLDPLYDVHWNNLAAPVEWKLQLPEGVDIQPRSGEGPKVEAAADADPREFLVDVTLNDRTPVTLTVTYFACNDAEGWCKPVTQRYTIEWKEDRDGGRSQQRGRPARRNRQQPDVLN